MLAFMLKVNLVHCMSIIPLLMKKSFRWAHALIKFIPGWALVCSPGPVISIRTTAQTRHLKILLSLRKKKKESIFILSHFIKSQDESLSCPRTLSEMTFLLSLWLVVRCICLLTSWFIYWCLAWNHGWHGIPWCQWKQVNIPVSLPAAAAPETWISAVHVTQATCWWERTNTLYLEY